MILGLTKKQLMIAGVVLAVIVGIVVLKYTPTGEAVEGFIRSGGAYPIRRDAQSPNDLPAGSAERTRYDIIASGVGVPPRA